MIRHRHVAVRKALIDRPDVDFCLLMASDIGHTSIWNVQYDVIDLPTLTAQARRADTH